jgi:hypothetical protein
MNCTDQMTAFARVARLRAGIGFRHSEPGLRAAGSVGAAWFGEASRNRFATSGKQYRGGRSAAPGDDR